MPTSFSARTKQAVMPTSSSVHIQCRAVGRLYGDLLAMRWRASIGGKRFCPHELGYTAGAWLC